MMNAITGRLYRSHFLLRYSDSATAWLIKILFKGSKELFCLYKLIS